MILELRNGQQGMLLVPNLHHHSRDSLLESEVDSDDWENEI